MYDLIGDVHGCLPELRALLGKLGYRIGSKGQLKAPKGRTLVFVGDLVDRGPDVPGTLRLVMRAVKDGCAQSVQGNHDWRLAAHLRGESVKQSDSIRISVAQLRGERRPFLGKVEGFLAGLPHRLELDGGRLIVVHAGERDDLPGDERAHYAVHGRNTGERDEYGSKIREDWGALYTGPALVVSGHTPVLKPRWSAPNAAGGRSVNLDTGCVYGGRLTALRYPELKTVSVRAQKAYASSKRFAAAREGKPKKG